MTGFKYYRRMANLTREELARLSGVSKSTINNAESGKNITINKIILIARSLDVSVTDLLTPIPDRKSDNLNSGGAA